MDVEEITKYAGYFVMLCVGLIICVMVLSQMIPSSTTNNSSQLGSLMGSTQGPITQAIKLISVGVIVFAGYMIMKIMK